jgi:hypothetical protein
MISDGADIIAVADMDVCSAIAISGDQSGRGSGPLLHALVLRFRVS